MKRVLIAAACSLLVTSQLAIAQNNGIAFSNPQSGARPSPSVQQLDEAQSILNRYHAHSSNGGSEGREILESVHAKGLAKTADNVKTIGSLLSSTVTDDEKVVLVRLLGSLYTFDDKTGMNSEIARSLKSAVYSGHNDVARAGALAYSRLAYFTDSNDVLIYAKNNGYIDADEYFGEIAHLLPYAPAKDQSSLATIVKTGKNRYAMEILAFVAQDPEVMKRIYPETKTIILSSLETNEPEFAQAVGEFGFVDAIRYANWLQTVAVLKSANGNVKYEDVVLAHLNDAKTDPRKIIAFLMSSDGKALIMNIGKSGLLDSALVRVSEYFQKVPQNVNTISVFQDIADTVNSAKR